VNPEADKQQAVERRIIAVFHALFVIVGPVTLSVVDRKCLFWLRRRCRSSDIGPNCRRL